MVMEYCSGGTLRSHYRQQPPLDEMRALQLLQPLLEGLAFIHSKRVVHRDIKSENVLLTGDNVVKIADFGLAKNEENTLSRTHRAGTPLYMSPEANRGHAQAPADIFALGVLAVEMATRAWPPLPLSSQQQVLSPRTSLPPSVPTPAAHKSPAGWGTLPPQRVESNALVFMPLR